MLEGIHGDDGVIRILKGDCREVLKTLPDESVHCVVTSPPYWGLRDYGVDGQLGLEASPQAFVDAMRGVFAEVHRVLRDDGTLWLNLGDSYAGSGKGGNPEGSPWAGFVGNKDREKSAQASKPIVPAGLKPKDLVGIPWRVAFALQADGWYLRQDIIWAKPNPMPESVRDRCTKSHEYLFLLAKSERYWFDAEAIAEDFSSAPGPLRDKRNEGYGAAFLTTLGEGLRSGYENGKRNKRSVWTVTTQPFADAHFATFPPALIEPCILAGCPEGGTVLDPFFGAGTTGLVADRHKRSCIGIELNQDYAQMAERRIRNDAPLFVEIA